jgi:DNA modification methylase
MDSKMENSQQRATSPVLYAGDALPIHGHREGEENAKNAASVANAAHIEHLAVADLTPYARNSRTHSPEQVAQVAASIREFGFTNPVLIDAEGGIIAGHGRVMAAQSLGLESVPCIRLAHLSDAQKRAYIIADNKLALNAGWDNEILALELKDLGDLGFDLELTGFELGDIDQLLAQLDATPEGETDADAVPDVQAEVVTLPGDVWLLGKHRIMCGDSTSADHVATLLGGGMPHLMVTDPPYGVEYDADWRNHAIRANGSAIGGGAVGKVENDDKADWREAWSLFPGEVAYVWHAGNKANVVADSLIACGFDIRAQVIWAKNQLVIGRGHYHPKHEPCWYAVKQGGTGHWQGDRKQTTLWEINKPHKSETGHSTQKPVECMLWPIQNNSAPGDSVYEPFSGSGTTLIAAEQTGRICYAMELSPAYVDVAVRRWQQYTGRRALHATTGAEFPA